MNLHAHCHTSLYCTIDAEPAEEPMSVGFTSKQTLINGRAGKQRADDSRLIRA